METEVQNSKSYIQEKLHLPYIFFLDLPGTYQIGINTNNVFYMQGFFQKLSPVVVVFSLLQLVNVPFLQQHLVVLYDKQWATDATSVSVDSDLTVPDIPDHRNLG